MAQDVNKWVDTAQPGERLIYHSTKHGDIAKEVAEAARAAHDRGLVFLAQRRRASGAFTYEAQRISPRTRFWLERIQVVPA